MTNYCPKCRKELTTQEEEELFCLNCGKLAFTVKHHDKQLKPEDRKKQKYLLISAIIGISLISVTIALYIFPTTPQLYQYSMECKKLVDNGTMPIFQANLTLTKSQIQGNFSQECISYGEDNYCYQVGMNQLPTPTDPQWTCNVLSMVPLSNYSSSTLVPLEVKP
ncbi:MAG: hypothetical protein KGI28_02655 [Thaumarchaeota archaeon]|nr:hypothetical protein [Nitrososphaerota archaeon]